MCGFKFNKNVKKSIWCSDHFHSNVWTVLFSLCFFLLHISVSINILVMISTKIFFLLNLPSFTTLLNLLFSYFLLFFAQKHFLSLCSHVIFVLFIFPSKINYLRLSDVGMIMMQTGMVKQGLNSICHNYLDGTVLKRTIFNINNTPMFFIFFIYIFLYVTLL